MRTSKEMADLIFQIRDSTIERKKNKHKRIMYVVKFAAPAAACFGLAITFGISYWAKYEKMSDVVVQPSTIYTTTADADSNKTSITTAVTDRTVTTTAKTDRTVSGTVSAEEDNEQYAITEETAVSEESVSSVSADTPIKAETQTPVPTEQPAETLPQMTETDERKAVKGAFKIRRLLESEDPITVFNKINVDGKDYEGYRYIRADQLERFSISWTEGATLTVNDTVNEEIVAEPVTIHGIRNKDYYQEFIIVNFTNYDIYALYWAAEGDEEQTADNDEQIENEVLPTDE